MIAHIRKSDQAEQQIKTHCENTALLCEKAADFIKLGNLARLIGLLHDMGKYTKEFYEYIKFKTIPKGEVLHSPIGAIFAFERWYKGDSAAQKCTAQIIAMVIFAHHSGFMDILDTNEASPFYEALNRDKKKLYYDEAVNNYLKNIADSETLDILFNKAVIEFAAVKEKAKFKDKNINFYIGLVAREMLSILVDSDRWDSACFEYGTDPFKTTSGANWKPAVEALEAHIASIGKGKLSQIRNEISEACKDASKTSNKIYRLTVPTGGGKTFASLRFALNYADINNVERIFYIIPFNTILDQNAKDMRGALNDTLRILEHHSNVVFDDNNRDEIENHKLLTERWTDCDLILTSMVQFLNCIFRNENTNARRMCRLSNSVLIFDEIQALPKKCITLFEKAINFLVELCGCTVVLCTATQPDLSFQYEPVEMYPDPNRLFETLRRTEIINETDKNLITENAADKAVKLVDTYGAVLMIVNTKRVAENMYNEMKNRGIMSIHLSTDMYPEHRKEIIQTIKERDTSAPLFCVSTALIEAGINISFPCVIRSLSGIGSIIQAAGRCNRNAELPDGELGKVYVWKLADESLKNLEEIEMAQEVTQGVMEKYGVNIDTLDGISKYYDKEKEKFKEFLNYPLKNSNVNLVDLLGKNLQANGCARFNDYVLRGAYRTAEENFNVIEQNTRSVLISRGRGEEIYHKLCGDLPMCEKIPLLREAARYSVSIPYNRYEDLYENKGAIIDLKDCGVSVLRKEYYNEATGVTDTPGMLNF